MCLQSVFLSLTHIGYVKSPQQSANWPLARLSKVLPILYVICSTCIFLWVGRKNVRCSAVLAYRSWLRTQLATSPRKSSQLTINFSTPLRSFMASYNGKKPLVNCIFHHGQNGTVARITSYVRRDWELLHEFGITKHDTLHLTILTSWSFDKRFRVVIYRAARSKKILHNPSVVPGSVSDAVFSVSVAT